MHTCHSQPKYVDTKGEKLLFCCNDYSCFWIGDDPEMVFQNGEWIAWCPVCGHMANSTKEV